MDAMTYFLAFNRLSTRSVVYWGHAVTSGIHSKLFHVMDCRLQYEHDFDQNKSKNSSHIYYSTHFDSSIEEWNNRAYHPSALDSPIYWNNKDGDDNSDDDDGICDEYLDHNTIGGPDYFISSKLFESTGNFAQLEYVERLILMNSMTTYFYYPPLPFHRTEFKKMLLNQHLISETFSVVWNRTFSDFKNREDDNVSIWIDSIRLNKMNGMNDDIDSKESHGNLRDWNLPTKNDFLSYVMLTDDRYKSCNHDNLSNNTTHETLLNVNVSDFCQFYQYQYHHLFHNMSKNHIYAIPQTLYKLRPDFDVVIERILQLDEYAVIAIPYGSESDYVDRIMSRIMSRIGKSSDNNTKRSNDTDFASLELYLLGHPRILFLRNMNEREYLTYCAISDVVLDPWPVGGGRSSLEIFSTTTPIVVYYNPNITTSILQLTYAMYQTMGVELFVDDFYNKTHRMENSTDNNRSICCVAYSLKSYISMAIHVASNQSMNNEIRKMIASYSHRLYENISVIDEWNKVLKYIYHMPRPIPNPISYRQVRYASMRQNEFYVIENETYTKEYLSEVKVRLQSNPLWIKSELRRTVFTYIKPAISMEEVDAAVKQLASESQLLVGRDLIPVSKSIQSMQSKQSMYDSSSLEKDTTMKNDIDGNIHSEIFHIKGVNIGVHIHGIHLDEDWIDICLNKFDFIQDYVFLEVLFACNVIGKSIERNNWPNYTNLMIKNSSSLDQDNMLNANRNLIMFPIKVGDDLNQVMRILQKRYSFSDSDMLIIKNQLSGYFPPDEVGSMLWAQQRRNLVNKIGYKYLHYLNLSQDNFSVFELDSWKSSKEESKAIDLGYITIGITTCKRLDKFQAMISSLISSFGSIPNEFITKVIIVDDGSILEDRIAMMKEYPQFTYIFKSISEQGHANSLNILFRHVKTKYFMYLEDDWILNKPILSESMFQKSLNLLKSTIISENRIIFKEPSRNKVDSSSSNSSEEINIYILLISMLSILGFNGIVTIPSINLSNSPLIVNVSEHVRSNLRIDQREPIHQVLFNEQSSRSCAEGRMKDCKISTLGYGGWNRTLSMAVNFINISHDSIVWNISYSYHEFGYLNSKYEWNNRNHDFSNWPGISFNPGLWDMEAIKETFYRNNNNNNKRIIEKMNSGNNLFREDVVNKSFEQLFSLEAMIYGLNMAYLPTLSFTHIGDMSAYDIESITRPWQSTEILVI